MFIGCDRTIFRKIKKRQLEINKKSSSTLSSCLGFCFLSVVFCCHNTMDNKTFDLLCGFLFILFITATTIITYQFFFGLSLTLSILSLSKNSLTHPSSNRKKRKKQDLRHTNLFLLSCSCCFHSLLCSFSPWFVSSPSSPFPPLPLFPFLILCSQIAWYGSDPLAITFINGDFVSIDSWSIVHLITFALCGKGKGKGRRGRKRGRFRTVCSLKMDD